MSYLKRFLIFFISIILIIPIFYLATCYFFDLNIFTSLYILEKIYKGLITGKDFHKDLYLVFGYAFIPFFISVILLIEGKRDHKYGNAKWANTRDILKSPLNFKEGFILAKFGNKLLRANDGQSMLIVAPPGAGKTSSIAVPNLLTLRNSMVVLDIKGELDDMCGNYRREVLKNKVLIFNPYNPKDNTIKFNPFDKSIIEKLEFHERLQLVNQISNILFLVEKGVDPHWSNSAKSLFVFFALFSLESKGFTTFNELMRYPKLGTKELIADEKERERIKELEEEGLEVDVLSRFFLSVGENKEFTSIIRDKAYALSRIHTKEMSSIISSYTLAMIIFENPNVEKITDSNNFEVLDLRKEKITIFIKVKEIDVKILGSLIRVLLDFIANNLMQKESRGDDERVYFILDEFVRFGKMEKFLELPALSRSYNIPAIYITQTEAQIEKYYSKEDLRIITGNVRYRVFFTMNDYESAEKFSKEIGNLTRDKISNSAQSGKFGSNKNVSDEGYALITAQMLLNLNSDEVIISATGSKSRPIKAKVNYFFKNRYMRKIIKKYQK
ncbi:MAG: type IV secretory system conjugative DNA transfer family protein [Sulfurospirillum sp.]|nr:type IV secretory system conjugative DNA transfer family protein [Sulfurospirillum sp.]